METNNINVSCIKGFAYTTIAENLSNDDKCIKHWNIKVGTKGTVTDEQWRVVVTFATPIQNKEEMPYYSKLYRVFYKDMHSLLEEWQVDTEVCHEN